MEHTFQTSKQTQCSIEGDPDWWFDYKEVGRDKKHYLDEVSQETKMAISICNRCDALDECRAWALQFHNLSGVWGGLVPPTRTRLQKNMGMKPIDFTQTWGSPTYVTNRETA